jgi:DNA repair protein RadC
MEDHEREEFWMLLLNRANGIIAKIRLSEGGTSGTVVDPKIVFQIALKNLASNIVLCHNHPSGNLTPSSQDIELTKKLCAGARLLDICVRDHIILGNQKYFSFADEGLI